MSRANLAYSQPGSSRAIYSNTWEYRASASSTVIVVAASLRNRCGEPLPSNSTSTPRDLPRECFAVKTNTERGRSWAGTKPPYPRSPSGRSFDWSAAFSGRARIEANPKIFNPAYCHSQYGRMRQLQTTRQGKY